MNDRVSGKNRGDPGAGRDWRKICEEVLRERRPDRVNALLQELLKALEEREHERERERGARIPDAGEA
jgi:hypothetical protein